MINSKRGCSTGRRYTEAAGLLIGRDDATVNDAVDRLRGDGRRA
jgi:hypothetical protein